MTHRLSSEEIAAALPALAGWRHEATETGDALARTYGFASFRDALAFMVRAGFEAEALDHHPEWTNVYNRVAVRLNTHDAGGRVTAKDLELARRLDAVAAGFKARGGS
jgi:4a-hydroxytetrahydrobiopterin dehydratase